MKAPIDIRLVVESDPCPPEFGCPAIQGLRIKGPCQINSCIYHAERLNLPSTVSGCGYLDFQLLGYEDPFDYLSNEQAIYRVDFEYLSMFFNTPPKELLSQYEESRKIMQSVYLILQQAGNPSHDHHCRNCNHPTKDRKECVSPSLCMERRQAIDQLFMMYVGIDTVFDRDQIEAAMWESFADGKSVYTGTEELESLMITLTARVVPK